MPILPAKASDEVIILVAEDDADDRDMLCEVIELSNRNIVAVFVHDGDELLSCIHQLVMSRPVRFPDLVVLDVNMPRLNGEEALRRLKANPDTKEVPVAMLTTSKDPMVKERLLQLGACGFYSKPASMPAFKKVMHDILEGCLEPVAVKVDKD